MRRLVELHRPDDLRWLHGRLGDCKIEFFWPMDYLLFMCRVGPLEMKIFSAWMYSWKPFRFSYVSGFGFRVYMLHWGFLQASWLGRKER